MTWRIGEILIQKKLISWDQLNDVLEEQQRTRELTGEILIRKGYISRPLLYRTLAEQHGLAFLDLDRVHINPGAVEKIPKSIAVKFNILPLDLVEEILILGISNPVQSLPTKELMELAGAKTVRLALCLPDDIRRSIAKYYKEE